MKHKAHILTIRQISEKRTSEAGVIMKSFLERTTCLGRYAAELRGIDMALILVLERDFIAPLSLYRFV